MNAEKEFEAKTALSYGAAAMPVSNYLRCCDREIHYMEWGRRDAPVVLMSHGLARTGRDFDILAAALSDSYRVICPDMIGRGWSQWSPQPDDDYRVDFYARITKSLIDQLSIDQVRWIGTSMGGLIGVWAASTVLKGRISHLVMNDVSPAPVPQDAVARIVAYVSSPPEFDTVTEFDTYIRTVYKPFGQQTDAFWRSIAESSLRRLPNGKVTNHYHPKIIRQVEVDPHLGKIWDAYDSLTVPTLVLRGVESDVLRKADAQSMTERGPKARLVEIPGCGHCPALNTPDQITLIRDFIGQG